MYGKKRIILSSKIAAHTGWKKVYQKGGKSSNCIGVWYRDQMGSYYADLRSPEQEYKALSSRDFDIKGFGCCPTQKALREKIAALRGI
jgi:hypothetical protein